MTPTLVIGRDAGLTMPSSDYPIVGDASETNYEFAAAPINHGH